MEIRKARLEDVDGICRVCSEGWRATYEGIRPESYITRVIAEFYNTERVTNEARSPENWNGWFVAVEEGVVVGAGGGGQTMPGICEVFVLYLDPKRRGEGIGSKLLAAMTDEMKAQGAEEQWVSVEMNNMKGIPFYKARGFEEQGEKQSHASKDEEAVTSLRMKRKV